MNSQLRPILILGPTAGGKTELAAQIAQQHHGEVISADAYQIYQHMDAGTAKPDMATRQMAPHHFIDTIQPRKRFTVHDWLSGTESILTRLQQEGKRAIIVGGTNLYMQALLEGLDEGPSQDPTFRASLAVVSGEEMHQRLQEADPVIAERLHPNDRQRMIRALEVFHITGTPFSTLQTQWKQERALRNSYRHNPVMIGMQWNIPAINKRINLRVKAMFYPEKVTEELAAAVCIGGESLIDETQRLLDEGHFNPMDDGAPNQAREALGTKQLLQYIEKTDHKIRSIDDAFERTKILTRRFAKQQRTWLRRFQGVHWIKREHLSPEQTMELCLKLI